MSAHHGRDFACAAGGQEGENLRFSPSCGSPLSLRRATGAVNRGSAKRLPPSCCYDRHGLAATPEGCGSLCFRLTRRNGVPAHHRRDFACAAGGQEGENLRFSPSCGSPLSLRRATGAVYRCSAKRLPPSCCCDRHGLAATPEGWRFPFLLLLKSGRQFFSVTHLCARQRALICGSKCRKSSGRHLTACSR